MAVSFGSTSATSFMVGTDIAMLRLGSLGIFDLPGGLAILDVSVSGGVTTLVHSQAVPNGTAVSYEYEYQAPGGGPPFFLTPLPVEITPISSEDGLGFVRIQANAYDIGGSEYAVRVRAVNAAGFMQAEVNLPATAGFPQSWPTGSLPDVLQDEFASLGPDAKAAVFSGGERDEEAWFYPIDLRGVATTEKGGSLITPRHALYSAHYPPTVGSTVSFNGISKTVDAVAVHPGYDPVTYRNDIAVARLDSDLSLPHFPVLPSDWARHVPSSNAYLRIPLLSFERGSASQEISSPLLESVSENRMAIQAYLRPSQLRPSIVAGDSGQPLFFVLNGQAILAGVWTNGFAGPFVSDHIAAINQMISQLGGGGQLTTVDLSAFPAF